MLTVQGFKKYSDYCADDLTEWEDEEEEQEDEQDPDNWRDFWDELKAQELIEKRHGFDF